MADRTDKPICILVIAKALLFIISPFQKLGVYFCYYLSLVSTKNLYIGL